MMEYDFQEDNYPISFCNNTMQHNDLETFKRSHPLRLWRQYGLFEDEYLMRVNAHWLRFAPAGKWSHYSLAILYGLIMIFGFIGNCLELFLYARCRSLRTAANMLVVNLAVSDLLMMAKIPIFIYNSALQGPALGDVGCRIYGFVGGLTGTISICSLAAIAVDRYRVVAHPLQPLRNISFPNARRTILFIWLYSLTFASIPLADTGLGSYVPEGYLTSCSFDYISDSLDAKLFILAFFAAAWMVPFAFIIFAYGRILFVVKRSSDFEFEIDAQRTHQRTEIVRKAELKVSIAISVIIGVWFAAWTPYAIVALLGVFGRADLITPFGSMIPALFCKTASCVDPFLYAVMHPRYRKELKNLCTGREKVLKGRTNGSMYTISSYRRKDDGDEIVSPEPMPQRVIISSGAKCKTNSEFVQES